MFTLIPAFFDVIAAFLPVVSQSSWALAMKQIQMKYLPFANIGMDWPIPALVGLIIGLICYFIKKARSPQIKENN